MREKQRRYKPEVRKAQIVEVTKQLIIERGLEGATVLRIAEALGISQATLYYHFKNRREILLDTLKSVMDEITAHLPSDMDDVVEFIQTFSAMVFQQTRKNPQQARLLFELLSAPPDEGMHDEIQKQITNLHAIFEIAIQKGVQQGLFREDTDTMLIAWELMSFGIATFLGSMLELPKFISLEQGLSSINRALDSIRKR